MFKHTNLAGLHHVYHRLFIIQQGCYSISFSQFPDFSLTFDHFPGPFGRPILAIFIHPQFENVVQICMLADLIFKEKSQTINIGKVILVNINCKQMFYVFQKHSFYNIACNLWKIKFPKACYPATFWENFEKLTLPPSGHIL